MSCFLIGCFYASNDFLIISKYKEYTSGKNIQ
uniref:Uncharacterized protein n=1 Tax=Rhizophora mucronata TaxID=61149 RepID=A0A2P2PPR7_RHIMU